MSSNVANRFIRSAAWRISLWATPVFAIGEAQIATVAKERRTDDFMFSA